MDHKWTSERKKELLDSRVGLTKILVDAIANSPNPPKAFVSGFDYQFYRVYYIVSHLMRRFSYRVHRSAIGIYPVEKEKTFDETYQGPWNPSFAGQLVKSWEDSVNELENKNPKIRRAIVRTGVVLSRSGGALPQLVLPFGLAVSGRIGYVYISLASSGIIMHHQ
jgi:NAD dependent epimerase/dehydratase family enzyme